MAHSVVSLFWLRVLDKAEYSAFESTLNSAIVSYRIVSYFKVFYTVGLRHKAWNVRHMVSNHRYASWRSCGPGVRSSAPQGGGTSHLF